MECVCGQLAPIVRGRCPTSLGVPDQDTAHFVPGGLFGEQAEKQGVIDPETPEFVWQEWATEALSTIVVQLPSITGLPWTRAYSIVAVNHAVERLADGNTSAFARVA